MPRARVVVRSALDRTPRVLQVQGLFDIAPVAEISLRWDVDLPLDGFPWNVGLIVGPSGSGKTTLCRTLFGDALQRQEALAPWPVRMSLLEGFPEGRPVKEIVTLLSSVGFSSPPSWLRPYRVLSTGEQFRANLARLLAFFPNDIVVLDEFTSVVDRTVARVGSAAFARAVRNRGQRVIAVTCHEDVEEWLRPDWIYRPRPSAPDDPEREAPGQFTRRLLRPRPTIALRVCRVGREMWAHFRHHHYLNSNLAPGAVCFAAFWESRPIAFSAWIHSLTRGGGKREHRTVVLPDYQGIGVGMAISTFCASLWKACGHRATSTTSHPGFLASRQRSAHWRMIRPPSLGNVPGKKGKGKRHATARLTAGFEYTGPPMDPRKARLLVHCRWKGV